MKALIQQRINEGYEYAYYPFETGTLELCLNDKTYLAKSYAEAIDNISSCRGFKSIAQCESKIDTYQLFNLVEELTNIWEAEEEADRKAFEKRLEQMEG